MRILHTSDWHFGRSLHGQDLSDSRTAFGRWLLDTVEEHAIDLVLVSGDIYDRAIPSVSHLNEVMNLLHELSTVTKVLLTPGNHDSATRLGAYSQFLRGNVQVCARIDEIGTAREFSGPGGDPGVLIYPVPYLEPDLVRGFLAEGTQPLARTHQAVMDAALRRIGRDLLARRKDGDLRPAVVMAHAFIVGASPSDSERNIEVGGVPSISASTFDTFGGLDLLPSPALSYVALGHLHRPQRVLGSLVPMRYSGSPIAYSFSEAPGEKSAVVIEITGGETGTVPCVNLVTVDIPSAHPLVVLRGCMDDLLHEAQRTDADAYVSLTITDDARPQAMVSRLRAVFPHALSIIHSPEHAPILNAPRVHLESVDLNSTLADFFHQAGGQEISKEERAIITHVLDAAKETNS